MLTAQLRCLVGVLALAFVGFGEAAAQTTDAAKPPVAPAPATGDYTLFNPTPDDQMRPFCTDRPGKSHCAQTVDPGHIQIEGDIWNYTWDRWQPNGTTTRAYTLVNPNIKVGLNSWLEFDAIFPVYNRLYQRTGNVVTMATGYGDTFLGGKVNFFGNDGGDSALGAIAFVKIPTGAAGLGNGRTEFVSNLPYTIALPDKFSLTLEPGLGYLRNQDNGDYHENLQMIGNLNRPIIGDTVTAAIEIDAEYPTDRHMRPIWTIDPSLQWLVRPNVQLDAGIYFGLTKAAPDFNPYLGISFRY